MTRKPDMIALPLRAALFLIFALPALWALAWLSLALSVLLTPPDLSRQLMLATPLFIAISAILTHITLKTLVIPPARQAPGFRRKTLLGSGTLYLVTLTGQIGAVYLGWMTPAQSGLLAGAATLLGLALMLRFWWIRR